MPFDFPGPPLTVGQTATAPTGAVYVWDGVAWRPTSVPLPPYAPLTSPVFQGDPQVPLAPIGDADQSIASTQFVTRAVAPAQNSVGRNLLHNPLFNVAQRGAGPFSTSGAYTLDRWKAIATNDTIAFSSNPISDAQRTQIGDEAATVCLLNTFTGNAAAASFNAIYQPIEAIYRLGGKTVTVSFYAIASAALRLGTSLTQYFGTGGSPSATVALNGQSAAVTTTYARYSFTFTLPSLVGKTAGTNGDAATYLYFWYSAGANNNTQAGGVGVQSGTISIWGVQLEIGSVATPLDYGGTPADQLRQCQRFYISLWAWQYSYAPGSGYTIGNSYLFPTTMRASPTLALTGTPSNVNIGPITVNPLGVYGCTVFGASSAAGAVAISQGFTASSDL